MNFIWIKQHTVGFSANSLYPFMRIFRNACLRLCEQLRSGFLLLARLVPKSFFHTFKTDLMNYQADRPRDEARQALIEYIEIFYRCKRHHSGNGYMSTRSLQTVTSSGLTPYQKEC